ncbi:helix-turn-helix domain-containing protein [Priestia sp. FSL R5-0597]|uniref:helix-turn-helix transcriptional regulator n=1 Tax=Priestia sp. FSL R5-0597 TaxID=2921580 RepID=UPI0030F6DD36
MNSLGVVTMPSSKESRKDDLKAKLKIRFAELDIPQHKVAEVMDESKQTVSAWANNHKEPSLIKAFRLAHFLGCKVDDLWEYIEEKDKIK